MQQQLLHVGFVAHVLTVCTGRLFAVQEGGCAFPSTTSVVVLAVYSSARYGVALVHPMLFLWNLSFRCQRRPRLAVARPPSHAMAAWQLSFVLVS